ncbi:hypothetical protein GARC_0310 [Paraglaciecola arctica BSs20135]|uniref:Uncharacterized protein n=1 Tax=Paraglaciecola arctica BSs20135 TaxID=493475 RepID=K6YGM7_9ALTE|nr:hypothetical protein GARC_0310 [Paraglaciecola arctica BSs20135]
MLWQQNMTITCNCLFSYLFQSINPSIMISVQIIIAGSDI